MKQQLSLFCFLLIAGASYGQKVFPNTLFYNDSVASPKATLSDIKWLAGHWQGEAFGGMVEEIWAPPAGNSMMGTFKLVVDDVVQFYEIETISEENGTLLLRLKHFNANLTAWEEKDETIDFKLVKVADHTIYFDGFTIEYLNENEMNMYVVIDEAGENKEILFQYNKVPAN